MREWRQHTASCRGPRRNGSHRGWRKKRALVIAHDGRRCTYVDEHGRRCPATDSLEVHHVDGDWQNDSPQNLTTRCRTHNPRPGSMWWADDMLAKPPNRYEGGRLT